jgi:hypothetical protein
MTVQYASPIDGMQDELLLIIDNNQDALNLVLHVVKLDSDDDNRVETVCRMLPHTRLLSKPEIEQLNEWFNRIDQMLIDDQPDYYIDYWLCVEKHYRDKIAEGV